MRSLIRPTLFMVARMGLSPGIVVWAVSQEYSIGWQLPTYHVITLDNPGWSVAERGVPLTFETVGPLSPLAQYTLSGGNDHSLGARSASIRHWLVVTIFALFYGALKWTYRKRGKAD
ncbi:MAG TPA: hypothetical protein EYQ63_33410 [Fuerstia sp.]|nr:hypothetical protein [Fuerstiella sp.]